MRNFTFLTLLLLLVAPAFGTIVDNGDGTVTSSQKSPLKFYTGFCASEWLSGKTCASSVGFGKALKTFVEIGVCTQQEADDNDPLPTHTCDQQYIDLGICPGAWHDDQNDPDVLVPHAQSCSKVVDSSLKLWGKARGQYGLSLYEARRAPAAGDASGDIVDP